jgi:hypothetical protein
MDFIPQFSHFLAGKKQGKLFRLQPVLMSVAVVLTVAAIIQTTPAVQKKLASKLYESECGPLHLWPSASPRNR